MANLIEEAILEGVRRNFDWLLEVDGVQVAMCQNVKIPKRELNVLNVGASGATEDVGLPGKPKKGELSIKAAMPLEGTELFWDTTFEAAKAGVPGTYRYKAIIHLLNSLGAIRESYDLGKCFTRSIEIDELKKKESENEVLYTNIMVVPGQTRRSK